MPPDLVTPVFSRPATSASTRSSRGEDDSGMGGGNDILTALVNATRKIAAVLSAAGLP
ncbi:hypothetical protein GFY24_33430 [Nocardia sp. SYP-A9097]|uniref:hypothetical protein n=1 Tax=Nocardia sp. SYP-A9097 TaxID=2663237 RepID=UPI00129A51DF|nr:hypothetical protein [Nocardia sp. SYP-A9097]MRH92281.1 hypothetical protein [Nocardia sp. SYP-A9097]